MTKYTAPTVSMPTIHVDILRGLHPVHILRKYHLTVRELSAVLATYTGSDWVSTDAPLERGHAWWKAYFERKCTLSFSARPGV